MIYNFQKPLDQLPFACFKARYRAWLANRKLIDVKTNEEQAVEPATEIFKNISSDLIKSSWKMTGFKKFAHFGQFWSILANFEKNSMSADSYVRIFRTSPVWQKWKSPDFLDKSCLAKTQKSGFFGVRILSEPL